MYISGKNAVKERLTSNGKINKALIYQEFSDQNIITELENKGIEIKYLSKNELDRFAKENHQGIILDVPEYKTYSLDELLKRINQKLPFIVMLDHLEDPHNFGAIIRTCESAGVDGIIIPKDRSIEINSTVIKTSSGAIEYMPICVVNNLTNAIKELQKKGYWVIGTDMDGTNYNDIDYNVPVCLVIGSEGNGMSRLVKESCDFIATIPMKGQVNSLNASVATAVMIYKIIDQRK